MADYRECKIVPSPNYNERPDGPKAIDSIIIHYTAMPAELSLERLCDHTAKVSSHYLIYEDGALFQLVKDEERAWHAGVSHWQGRDNLNDTSIGIELVNPGHDFGYKPFPEAQITCLLSLLERLQKRWNIRADRFIGHSDIAPDRKIDPGELFPWHALAERGFGLVAGNNAELGVGSILPSVNGSSTRVIAVQKLLAAIGYDIQQSGVMDQTTEDCLRAFRMHWMQWSVSKLEGFDVIDEPLLCVLNDIAEQVKAVQKAGEK